MALKHLFLTVISASMLLGTAAEAQYRHNGSWGGHRGGGGGPRPLPPDNGGQPGYPPPGGNYPPGQQTEQKTLQIQRRVVNERLPLLGLANLDGRYQGYTVESIEVSIRNSDPRTNMGLFINGNLDNWVRSPRGSVRLTPKFSAVIGQGIASIDLDVNGLVDMDWVVINLRRPDYGGGYPPPTGPQRLAVPLNVARRMLGNDRLDLTAYVNMNQYRGYRIEAIEFEAASLMNVSFVDVVMNNNQQGARVQVGSWIQRYSVNLQNAELSRLMNLSLYTYGNMDIRSVTLYLVACGSDNGGYPPGGGGTYPPQPPRPR